jgi:hypothetical protein
VRLTFSGGQELSISTNPTCDREGNPIELVVDLITQTEYSTDMSCQKSQRWEREY